MTQAHNIATIIRALKVAVIKADSTTLIERTYNPAIIAANELEAEILRNPNADKLIAEIESKYKPSAIGLGSPLVRMDEIIEIIRFGC